MKERFKMKLKGMVVEDIITPTDTKMKGIPLKFF